MGAMDGPLASHFAALADEARRLEPRVVRVSLRTKEGKTVLIIETSELPTSDVVDLSKALKAFRRRWELAAEFLIVNVAVGGVTPPPRGPRA
jgi:hypothetical protein